MCQHELATGIHVYPILNPLPAPSPTYPFGLSQRTGFRCLTYVTEISVINCNKVSSLRDLISNTYHPNWWITYLINSWKFNTSTCFWIIMNYDEHQVSITSTAVNVILSIRYAATLRKCLLKACLLNLSFNLSKVLLNDAT